MNKNYQSYTQEEIDAYNWGLITAQWQITKAKFKVLNKKNLTKEIRELLIFIHDEIEKEKK